MPFILCRVVWAETYADRSEKIYPAKMSNPELHSAANERLNFANEAGYAYGFVERNGSRIALENLGASKNDSEIGGVTVIWFAVPREDNRPRVVGWYENATAYRDAKDPAPGSPRKKWQYSFKTKYEDAHLVPEGQRFLLEVPAKRHRTDKGYIGEKFWFYPETSRNYDKFLESFLLLARDGTMPNMRTSEQQTAYEEGQQRFIELMVFARNKKLADEAKAKQKFNCQACGFNFGKFYGKIGAGFAEAHHKMPVSLGIQQSTIDDLDILCANCHRMVHRETPPIPIERLRSLIQENRS